MKLLYITNGINGSGGLERVLSIKTSYLADKLNYDVHILTLNDGDKNLFFEFSSKIVLHDVKFNGKLVSYFLSYKKGIQKVLDTINPDIISVCDDGLKGLFFPFIFRKKIPMIYERHASQQIEIKSNKTSKLINMINRSKFILMNFGAGKFNKFIVLTNGNISEWNLDNLKVIPNPIPFESSEKSKLFSKTVLAVGSQSYHKGYDRLLDIWKLVNKKYPNWKLEVYGKLNPSLKLELKSQKLEISDKVNFYPPIKDIDKKYKNSSIYVMTSRSEGFGMVLIEAMSFGIPCISFDCPCGPSDIISDQKDGFIIKNGDIQSFANAVIRLIEEEELRQTMGKNAIESVKKYHIDIIGKQWDDLFKKMVD